MEDKNHLVLVPGTVWRSSQQLQRGTVDTGVPVLPVWSHGIWVKEVLAWPQLQRIQVCMCVFYLEDLCLAGVGVWVLFPGLLGVMLVLPLGPHLAGTTLELGSTLTALSWHIWKQQHTHERSERRCLHNALTWVTGKPVSFWVITRWLWINQE